MEEEIKKWFDAQDGLFEKIYTLLKKTRKYFLWTFITLLIAFIIPLIGLVFALPKFLSIRTLIPGGF